MDTDLFYQFASVIESGTIARASEVLGMTPGALSRALKRLESEVGAPLFRASGRNIIPTPAAASLYLSSKKILDLIHQAKESARIGAAPALHETLRVSTFEVFSSHLISALVARGEIEGQMELRESVPGQIEDDIRSGRADVGLTYVPAPHPRVEHLPLGEIRFAIFAARGTPADLPYAAPTTELGVNAIQTRSLDGWPADRPRDIRYRFELLETALDLASRGKCRIACPSFLVAIQNERLKAEFRLHEVAGPSGVQLPRLKTYLVKDASGEETPAIKRFARGVRQALARAET